VSRLGAAVLGAAVVSGCAYYNTRYHSRSRFDAAASLPRAGFDSLAVLRYEDVVRKTSDAYRGRPEGDEVAETLFLLGRAHLRLGRPNEAHAALAAAAGLASATELRGPVLVAQAFAASELGEEPAALRLLDDAFQVGLVGATLGEAYLLRGRLKLDQRGAVLGWEDLELAASADRSVTVDAGLEVLRWGVRHRNLERARSALGGLLAMAEAAERVDTIQRLVSAAAVRWSPSVAATMLGDVGAAAWDRPARSRLQLQQASLFRNSGDTAVAEELAWRVARGRGVSVAQARILLAEWRFDRTRDLGEAQSVLATLLPAGDDPEVADVVDAVEDLDRYSGIGLDDPLGLFAAAEVARDRLHAPILARGLFLAYADTNPSEPWAAKALLAALDVSTDVDDRSWLRGRLEGYGNSPYVQAARGDTAAGIDELEEELSVRLSEIAAR
jgi:hypothetical protein